MDQLKVIFEIHSAEGTERSGMSANNKPYNIIEQEAWVHIGDAPYPQKTKLTLESGQTPYPVGRYRLHERSFNIGKYHSFQCRPFLVPIAQSAQKAS